ncbi:MAG: hypothetical protein EOM20_21185, partial [Spartobacteria bacterium]|nr:hypothetical protein [Spartobacteria bacterium]
EAWLIDCVVTGNAVLDNSSDGGGAYGGAVEGCVIAGNTALGAASRGGGLAEATCSQSTLTSNQAIYGGGSFGGVLSNCTIDCNTAQFGGGGYDGTFYQCQLTGNTASNGGGLFEGAGYDCVFSNNATLGANGYGGGASQSELHRCRLLNNTAYQGGGARLCELYNCLLAANQADYGGGAASCDAVNCTVVNNDAVTFGGGAFWGTFRNSIVYYNTAFASHNCYESVCTNSCASPLPAGTNNITAAPGFADYAAGDFTLASDSDCIDRGTNQAWMVTGYDLDGNARLFNAIVDMGAYEFSNATLDSDGDGILDIYETDTGVYAGATDTGTDPLVADTDGDNMPDGDEVAAGTDPTDNASWLGMMAPVTLYDGGYVIAWQSASNRSYRVERATNMLTGFDAVIQTNIPATPYINTITDITASASSIYLYRVRTELEE